jgi:hypothetical protein
MEGYEMNDTTCLVDRLRDLVADYDPDDVGRIAVELAAFEIIRLRHGVRAANYLMMAAQWPANGPSNWPKMLLEWRDEFKKEISDGRDGRSSK